MLNKNLSVIAFLTLLFISYLLLSPHIASYLNPLYRKTLWNNFRNKLLVHKEVLPTEFWQFRDFYYPGTIEVNTFGLNKNKVNTILRLFPLNFINKQDIYPFLIYSSNKITSVEYLVRSDTLSELMQIDKQSKTFLNSQHIFFIETDKKAYLYFVKPVSDLLTANGYFDYKKRDKELLKDKYWLVLTIIDMQ